MQRSCAWRWRYLSAFFFGILGGWLVQLRWCSRHRTSVHERSSLQQRGMQRWLHVVAR
jgi:hypothetical protein